MANKYPKNPRARRRTILIYSLWIAGGLVVLEIAALIWLYSQVGRYEQFWQQHNQRAEGAITYVALGDSAAQGIGATSPMRSYVGVLASRIEQKTGRPVRLINLSKTGAKLNDAPRQLQLLARYEPDIVTVALGANDVKQFEEERFRRQFKQLVDQLPPGTFVADTPDFGWGKHLAKQRRSAEVAREVIASRPELTLVPLDSFTQEHFQHFVLHYAPDLFHPNNLGYQVWADAFWQTIEPEL